MENKSYLVAIGCSAGGLEALESFFHHTPLDGVSYVIIPHLSSDFKSRMVEILSKHTSLNVLEATEGLQVENNNVYLIPSTKYMGIRDGKLFLIEKAGHKIPHLTVDSFFTSLAEERGNKAIGVILSGTGSDGSQGINSIQKAGGYILVQDPADAKFEGMPNSAIANSNCDNIFIAEELPMAIQSHVHRKQLADGPDDESLVLSDTFLSSIINLIKKDCPVDFTDYKIPTIARRVRKRMIHHHLKMEDSYYAILKQNPEEVQFLFNDFLIGVTAFFRDTEAFNVIENEIIPQLVDQKPPGEILKVWVASCATGEEAYSLAILIQEYLQKNKKTIEVKIFATDINSKALEKASKGVFSNSIEKSVSEERLANFFEKGESTYKIKAVVRKMLIFAQHDLTKHPAYCNVDLISCRNMLIYIEPLLQKQVLAKFSFGLRKDGFLFLGSSESITSAKNDFIEINAKWKIFQRSGSPRSAPVPSTFPLPINIIRPENSNRSDPARANFSKQLSQELSEIILAESNLSGVCLDENFEVTRALGDVSLYLRQEQFNFNFKELLPETLSVAFSTAVHKVIRYNKRVEIKNILVKDLRSSKNTAVDLVVSPYTERTIKGTGILVLFKKKPEEISTDRLPEDFHIDTQIKEHVNNLEEELLHIRQDFQATNELLESSKESMQSFNEELLSGNEELQSANEELQSMNEELESINVEHKSTIDELIELNDDLNNYFKSNLNGQLFVDTSLKLKKYSPGAVKHINIRERDIGRPLSNITTNIELETIIEDIKTVIKTEEIIIQEVQSIDNKIYQVMTSPYIRQKDNKTVGAIVTFYDITNLKETQKELDSSNKSLLRINEDLDNFVYAASHDLIAPINNIENVLAILNKKMDFTDPVVVKFSDIIANSIKNFKTVIKDLALIGTIEAEMRKDSLPESFEELFFEIKESISDKILDANATFSTDFQQKEIKFPRKNLRSILQNLISNALKFKDPNRNAEILIRTERRDEFIMLTVRDNGLGIEKNQLDYIFKMYKRIDTQTEGQGIGLYLIKKIIDASGGRVEVESEPGKGSTFKIYFKI